MYVQLNQQKNMLYILENGVLFLGYLFSIIQTEIQYGRSSYTLLEFPNDLDMVVRN